MPAEKRLSWQPGFSLIRKPAKKTIKRDHRHSLRDVASPRQYQFVDESSLVTQGSGAGRLVQSKAESTSSAPTAPAGPFSVTEPVTLPGRRHEAAGASSEDDCPDTPATQWTVTSHPDTDETSLTTVANLSHRQMPSEPSPMESLSIPEFVWLAHTSATIPSSMAYESLAQRFEPVLERYNNEFCKIPLTPLASERQSNPFQYWTGNAPASASLMHAVMALAGQHVRSDTSQSHRHTAVQLLRQRLSTNGILDDCQSILDTILILFSFDETQSAFGNWSTHLAGAKALIEANGGIMQWAISPRSQVQIAMLTWWDSITSLLSRQDCILPLSYFEAIPDYHISHGWDWFGLCGCPAELVKIVMQLARLSAEKQRISTMKYATIDQNIVSDLEQRLDGWYHTPSSAALLNEESMQRDQDSMHCSEAWRNGLLLFIYRVFHWKPGTAVPMHVVFRARIIVDHVFACRDGVMTARQALFPLFLAGCELRDASTRKKIISLCSHWNEKTRYFIFGSAMALLEEIWAQQEAHGAEDAWWGQIVDSHHTAASQNPLQMRITFG